MYELEKDNYQSTHTNDISTPSSFSRTDNKPQVVTSTVPTNNSLKDDSGKYKIILHEKKNNNKLL